MSTDDLTDPREHLNEIQLIEEVVLVPEDELVVGCVIVDDLTPAPQFGDGLCGDVITGQMASANLEQVFVVHVPRHRTFVQRVGPDGGPARNPGLLDRSCRRRAIGNVEKPHQQSTSMTNPPGAWK